MNISVIGAGTMGNGIAHVFAQHGHSVNLIDISEPSLQKALQTITKNLERQVAKGSITEEIKTKNASKYKHTSNFRRGRKQCRFSSRSGDENEKIKLELFQKLDVLSPKHAILASNTSSISITKIASVTQRPEQVIGMHFMNPVPVMKLVEVIRGYSTSDKTTKTVVELSQKLSKIPVEVNDYPGFIANRILMPMINEKLFILCMKG